MPAARATAASSMEYVRTRSSSLTAGRSPASAAAALSSVAKFVIVTNFDRRGTAQTRIGPCHCHGVLVATAAAGVAGVERVGVEPELDVLAERLRDAARSIRRDRQVEAQRVVRVVVLAGEHADGVGVGGAGCGLAVAGDLTGECAPRAQPGEGDGTDCNCELLMAACGHATFSSRGARRP